MIYYHTMKNSMIEKILVAYLGGWERKLSASLLAKALGISREHAGRGIMPWVRAAYALSDPEGSHSRTAILDELEHLPEGLRSPRDVMDILPGLKRICEKEAVFPSCVRLGHILTAEGDPEIFRDLYAAMCRKEAVLIKYKAKSGDTACWFSPHSLVDLPHRPHFRGYVHWLRSDEWGFIDVVPSRVTQVNAVSKEKFTGGDKDTDWHDLVTIDFLLSKELPGHLRETVIQEWGHRIRRVDGEIVLQVPGMQRALVRYVRDALLWRSFHGEPHKVWIQARTETQ